MVYYCVAYFKLCYHAMNSSVIYLTLYLNVHLSKSPVHIPVHTHIDTCYLVASFFSLQFFILKYFTIQEVI